jgi:parallel beta-helix repeat protein
MRAQLVTAMLAVISVSAAGCTGHGASVPGQAYLARVSCGDSPADAGLIQRAINASRAGAVIEISGTCFLARGITLLPNRAYTGDSRTGTVLRQGAAMRFVIASAGFAANASVTGAPLSIRELTVACSGNGNTDGIIILNWQADVTDVNVSNCGGSGIVDTNQAASGASITNTSVNSRFEDNFVSGSGANGFEITDNRNSVTDGHLLNNQIASSGGDAIRLENAAGWDVSGNHLYNNQGDGILAERLYGSTISDNYIEDFGRSQRSGTWYGIAGTAQDGNGSTISGNKVFNDLGESSHAGHIYIGIIRTNAGTGYISVTGNVIVGASQGDIGLSFMGGAHHLVVASAGNVIGNVGTVTQHSGSVDISGGA